MKTKKIKSIALSTLVPPSIKGINLDKCPTSMIFSGELLFRRGVTDIAIFGAVEYISEALIDHFREQGILKAYSYGHFAVLTTGQEIHFYNTLDMLDQYKKNQIYITTYYFARVGSAGVFRFDVRSPLDYDGAERLSDEDIRLKIILGRYAYDQVGIKDVVNSYAQGTQAALEPKENKSLLNKIFEFFKR